MAVVWEMLKTSDRCSGSAPVVDTHTTAGQGPTGADNGGRRDQEPVDCWLPMMWVGAAATAAGGAPNRATTIAERKTRKCFTL